METIGAPGDDLASLTALRRAQTMLNHTLTGQPLITNDRSRPTAEYLRSRGYLRRRANDWYDVAEVPPCLCRRCYLAASRRLRDEVKARPPSRAQVRAQVKREEKAAREASWREASAILGLYPAAELFECPECGRWAEAVVAHHARARLIASVPHLDDRRFKKLSDAAREAPIRAAYLQRELGTTYEEAITILEAASRVGLLEERGKGSAPAAPRCAQCYERREASITGPERRSSSREPIPSQLRFRVLQRDGFRCTYCGRSARDGAVLHVDHVVPVAGGGQTTEDNLVAACDACNLGKSASSVLD